MATQIDARVKQKTGTAADFAGYNLLEGEIALVRTSASGPVWNFKVGPGNFDELDWSLALSGAAQEADTSTVFPTGVPGLYIPTEDGTYDGVSVDLSDGYNQLIWDGTTLTKVVFPLNLSGYATADNVTTPDQFENTPVENENLFNKIAMVRRGVIIDSDDGSDEAASGARTGLIYVGDAPEIWVAKDWSGAPGAYAWYDENQDFIQYTSGGGSSGIPDSPGGKVPVRPANGRYISLNLSNNPANTDANADSLMVYIGTGLIAYKPFKYNLDITRQYGAQQRPDSYFKAITAMYADSAMNKFTDVTGTNVGRWQIRTEIGATATKFDDYVRLTVDGITGQPAANAGLLLPWFFRPEEQGMRVWFQFQAKHVSGAQEWSIYPSHTAQRVDVNISSSAWNTYAVQSTVGANQSNDWRLLFGMRTSSTAATVDIRDFRVYFTDPAGLVATGQQVEFLYNTGGMANYQYKKAVLLSGGSTELILGLFGDSWTDHVPGSIFYARDIARALRSELGNGGGGWYDFANSNAGGQKMASIDPDDATDTRSGTITYKDQSSDAKGITVAHAEFGNGSELALDVLTNHERFVIHYYGGASYGTFRYRIDGGTWNTVDTSADTGHQTITANVGDATHLIEFEVTSGTCIILGVDMQRLNGVRIHKFGNRGLYAYNMASINAGDWQDAVASYNLDSMTVLVGTNDRTADRTPDQFKSNMELIATMYRAANQYGDLALISPSNNKQDEPYDMQEYADSILSVAKEKGLPYVSLIPLFGSREQIIDKGTFSDDVHPTEVGGKMIADYLIKNILS